MLQKKWRPLLLIKFQYTSPGDHMYCATGKILNHTSFTRLLFKTVIKIFLKIKKANIVKTPFTERCFDVGLLSRQLEVLLRRPLSD